MPTVTANLVDKGIIGKNLPYIWQTGGEMLLVSALGLLAAFGNIYFASHQAMQVGQRLRAMLFSKVLTIARALLADPEILILDEATSSVDTRTESLIQKVMADLKQERTSFVIAHRLSTIQDVDKIIVINHGQIVESGNHQSLLAKVGFYADLYQSQFLGQEI